MPIDHIHIDSLPLASGGEIGMCACPGRCRGAGWRCDLSSDIPAIRAWGADYIVSLVERAEFARLGVPDLPDLAQGPDHLWVHFPIPDMSTPDRQGARRWHILAQAMAAQLASGHRVLIHCAAGLGRTGTVAAGLLIHLGWPPETAIGKIRTVRPGTIETDDQLRFLRDMARVRGDAPHSVL